MERIFSLCFLVYKESRQRRCAPSSPFQLPQHLLVARAGLAPPLALPKGLAVQGAGERELLRRQLAQGRQMARHGVAVTAGHGAGQGGAQGMTFGMSFG